MCVCALHANLMPTEAVVQGVELRTNSATCSHRYESHRTCSLPVMVTVNSLTLFSFWFWGLNWKSFAWTLFSLFEDKVSLQIRWNGKF